MKHYSNINNSGYNWSSVPLKKMSIVDEMIQKIHKPRVKKIMTSKRKTIYIFTQHRIKIPVLYKAKFNDDNINNRHPPLILK